MTYTGHIKNGVVVLDNGNALPEGARVEVQLREESMAAEEPKSAEDERQTGTLYEVLQDFIGIVDDAPPDLARNHDHYLYGHSPTARPFS